ncbi:MAG: bifunctional phosphopantothenoylcysteine decarboxylase/phosphopantothenate--cysteine ligase CoaBC [Chloroflexi bacterium]|nr:bifunctional phosphopantothenoylcysteine decarboxylase/phosphopantothenate--cysteine ligase CoaBC [Chloroflexota bacterium]
MVQERITLLQNKRIVLGVTGGIAAYKVVDLASKLTQAGALVDVVMTAAAREFVTPLTFQAVTGRAVHTALWGMNSGGLPTHIAHIGLGESADLLLIAPATANTLAKMAAGLADDLLTVTVLAARCPLLVSPAMDGGMYEHAATQENLATLRRRGVLVAEPEEGRFASGLVGKGRLPETQTLIGAVRHTLGRLGRLRHRKIVITAGGTREPLDPVRFITNRSSGKQGYALAQAALDLGAQVVLVSAARTLLAPYGAQVVPVETAEEMCAAVVEHMKDADALLMAAAVADFRPQTIAEQKIKKREGSSDGLHLDLVRTPDILLTVSEMHKKAQTAPVLVGFAAESEHLLENAASKLRRKGLDLLVANDIRSSDAGFDVDTNRAVILDKNGGQEVLALASKAVIAESIMQRVGDLMIRP